MTKPKRGDCATCHWFQVHNVIDTAKPKDAPRMGQCLVSPPVASVVMVPVPLAQNPALKQQIQAIWPPVPENCRCEKWRPAGMLPAAALTGGTLEVYTGPPITGTQKGGQEQ